MLMNSIKPHWAWFFAGPVVLVLGCVVAVAMLIMGTLNVSEGMQRVDVPGEGTITIEEPGQSTIFFEQSGVSHAQIPGGLVIEVRPAAGGEPLPLSSSGGSFTYNNGNIAGRNYRDITFPGAGQYHVTASLPPGEAARGRLALGGSPGAALGMALGGFFGVGGLSFVLCVVIVVVVFVMRSKSASRIRQKQYQQMHPPGPPPGAPMQ